MMLRKKVVIIGAGPTGLGAGYRLQELGEHDFVILERNNHVGGLSASFIDTQGFTWDIGGHVLFSHYEYFDRLFDRLLDGEYFQHQRSAWIRMAETWIPYPFQNNIRYLPKDLQWLCIKGLLNLKKDLNPDHFKNWAEIVFGDGITSLFIFPYNFKVWAHPLEMLDFRWVGDRVSVIDLETILRNIILAKDNVDWGPNRNFYFPRAGGTGEIFRRLARTIEEHILLGQHVKQIDMLAKQIVTDKGFKIAYDYLLNTGPLDKMVIDQIRPENSRVMQAASKLKHNGIYVAGIGIKGSQNDPKSWMYFPENNCHFYRVTNFHNYSPNNTPHPGEQRALLTEVSLSPFKTDKLTSLGKDIIQGLENVTLLQPQEQKDIVSTWEMNVDYGYPIPCLERDEALCLLQPFLESYSIFSRGRFGGWQYEVGNMDHSVMQGVEWVERIVLGTPERTYKLT